MTPHEIKKMRQRLVDKGPRSIKAIILYGSWAKGTACEDSDVDLLVIYRRKNKKARKFIDDMTRGMDREVSIVHAMLGDFAKEKWPVYTAAKIDGKVVFGDVDLSISKAAPSVKYSEFFKKSREFESGKIKFARKLLSDGLSSGVADYCFIASKHAIQAALAMSGEGYSSKMDVLVPLARRYFGRKISLKFQKLFGLYERSGEIYSDITKREARLAVQHAKEVIKVYDLPVGRKAP